MIVTCFIHRDKPLVIATCFIHRDKLLVTVTCFIHQDKLLVIVTCFIHGDILLVIDTCFIHGDNKLLVCCLLLSWLVGGRCRVCGILAVSIGVTLSRPRQPARIWERKGKRGGAGGVGERHEILISTI